MPVLTFHHFPHPPVQDHSPRMMSATPASSHLSCLDLDWLRILADMPGVVSMAIMNFIKLTKSNHGGDVIHQTALK